MSIFSDLSYEQLAAGPPRDANWVKSPGGGFYRLLNLDPEEAGLSGVSAVYIIWHAGMRPKWVYVGRAKDLAKALHDLAGNDEIMDREIHGGLFVTWSLIREEFQDGVVSYLIENLEFLVDNPAARRNKDRPIPVIVPGN
ncbi:MAG: hypothetical protein V3V55_04430 [Rhodospirillales bacterium]